MTENEILKQALEANNATILSLVDTIKKQDEAILKKDEEHRKETDALAARIKELTAQVAWLNRQLFGRKSEKIPIIDPKNLTWQNPEPLGFAASRVEELFVAQVLIKKVKLKCCGIWIIVEKILLLLKSKLISLSRLHYNSEFFP